jgi:nitroreductase
MKNKSANEEKEILRLKIRQLGHWLQKADIANEKKSIIEAYKTKLNEKIELYKNTFSKKLTPDLVWAENILKGKKIKVKNNQQTSCRDWKKQKVSLQIINKLLTEGIKAPTSANRQSVRFLVITKLKEKKYLAKMTKHSFVVNADNLILIGVDNRGYLKHEHNRLVMDAAVCAQNIFLSCLGQKLGTCFITADELNTTEVKNYFKIPDYIEALILLPIGYRKTTTNKPARMPLSDFNIR